MISDPFHFCASPTVSVVGLELGEDIGSELDVIDTPVDDASLSFESELTGEAERRERALSLSSVSSLSAERAMLDNESDLGGALMMLARVRLTTETFRTIVAGVTVIVDRFESLLSLVNSTFNSDEEGLESTPGADKFSGVSCPGEEGDFGDE